MTQQRAQRGGRRHDAGRRRWIARLTAVVIAPLLAIALLEGGLRLFGVGHSTRFLARVPDRDAWTHNPDFTRPFFSGWVQPQPHALHLPATKSPDTFRIVVLGASAAKGFPEPTLSFARYLEVMLRERFPSVRFEMVNTAMVAINSHVVVPIARECAAHDPDLVIVYLGNNEVIGPYGAGTVFQRDTPDLRTIRTGLWLRRWRLAQTFDELFSSFGAPPRERWQGMAVFADNHVPAGEARLEAVYGHYRRNLMDICSATSSGGTPTMLCTVAVNVKDCAPFGSMHRPDLSADELERWETHFELGKAHDTAGDCDEAAVQFRAAAEIDDRHAELQFRLGRCSLGRDDVEAAREHYRRALELDTLRFRADRRINAIIGEVVATLEDRGVDMVDVAGAFEGDARSNAGLPGNALFHEHVHMNGAGNHLAAATLFRSVAPIVAERFPAARPDDLGPVPRERCDALLAVTGSVRYRMSRELARLMIDRPPFDAQLTHEADRVRLTAELDVLRSGLTAGSLTAEADVYEQALARAPEDRHLRFNYGLLLLQRGAPDEARQQWERVLADMPDHLGALVMTSSELIRVDRLDEAETMLRRLARQAPDSVALHERLGDLRSAQDRLEEAADHYQRVLEMSPDRTSSRLRLARMLVDGADPAAADAHLDHLLEHEPTAAHDHYRLGLLLADRGRVDEAIAQLQHTVTMQGNHLPAHEQLARWFTDQGRTAEAAPHVNAATQLRAAGASNSRGASP